MFNQSLTKKARKYDGEKRVSTTGGVWESWTDSCKSMKLEHSFTLHKK